MEGERGKRGDFRADVEGLNVESGNCGFVNFYMYIIAQMEWKVNYMVFLRSVCLYFEIINSTLMWLVSELSWKTIPENSGSKKV